MRKILPALLVATMSVTPAFAQAVTGISQTDQNGTTTTMFAVSPQSQVAAADYTKWSADALNYRIAAATLAVRKAQRDDVKTLARADMAAANREKSALFAALNNKDRKIAKPSSMVSSKNAAFLDLLKKAPKASFDNLYLTQVADATPAMWALQKGYATDGADPVLRQVATLSVPVIERNYTAAKSLMPAALATVR